MKTSARLAQVEAHIKTSFALADSRAALAVDPAPVPGFTPASKIAAAIRTEQVQDAAIKAADRIRDGLNSAVAEAEKVLAEVAAEAERAVGVAGFIIGKTAELPADLPADIRAAAITLKGQPGAAVVARQLVLASENCSSEAGRMSERWLPRTKAAAAQAGYNSAEKIYRAAGLHRKANAAELLARRAKQKRLDIIEQNSRRRLGDA